MFDGVREFLNSKNGQIATMAVVGLAVLFLVIMAMSSFGDSAAVQQASERVFVCSETNKSFEHTIEAGEMIPVDSPYSGRKTGYPAERCYWTKDGKVKDEQTYVVTKKTMGQSGRTFCPDCGRLVISPNPPPATDPTPPPTENDVRPSKSE